MHANARVLLYSDTDDAGNLAGKLEQHGFRPLPATSREDALRIVTGRFPDIAIVDATRTDQGGQFRQDLRDLSPEGSMPTIVIGTTDAATADDDGLQIEFLPAPFRDAELFSRLDTLARLVTMQGELALRSETSELYGVEAPAHVARPDRISDSRILLIADDDSQRGAVTDMITSQKSLVTAVDVVTHPYEAIERLLQADFDAVVAVRGDDAEGLLNLCRDLRHHANLFNMPLLVLCHDGDATAHDQTYEAGASDVLDLSDAETRLLPRLEHLVKQQRYRQAMQEVYRESRHYAGNDALTGLFGHGYLHAHLQKQITECLARDKDLAIGFFDIAQMSGFNGEYGYVAGDRLLRQIGGAIGGLVRAEDLPARFGGDKFCVVLPDTDMASAAPVLHRIAGVINFTEFALPDVGEPVKVHLQTGCAGLQAGDTAENLIARARADAAGS